MYNEYNSLNKYNKEVKMSSLEVIYIELTDRCNLNCAHCGNGESQNISLPKSAVKNLISDFASCGGKKVMLTGGEPLLHPDLEEILNFTCPRVEETKISTNGYLLSEGFDFLFDNDLGFKISIDGTREIHNSIRKNPESYDRIVSAINKISDKKKNLTLRTTLMRENKDSVIPMLFELSKISNGIERINIWPVRQIGRAAQNSVLSPFEYKDFLHRLAKSTKGVNLGFGIVVGPVFGIEDIFAGTPIKKDDIYTCNLLKKTLEVSPKGEVYPCSFVRSSLGSIYDKSILEIFHSPKANKFRELVGNIREPRCSKCESYSFCKGGCLAESLGSSSRDIYCFR